MGYISIHNIEKYYYLNELSIFDIFLHNLILTIVALVLSFFGGMLSIILISLNLIGIGFAIYEVQIRLKTSLIKILIPSMLHGLGEIIVMAMIINISLDMFFIWYYKIIDSKYKNKNILKKYFYIFILSCPILGISSIIEVLISSKLFEKIFILGG